MFRTVCGGPEKYSNWRAKAELPRRLNGDGRRAVKAEQRESRVEVQAGAQTAKLAEMEAEAQRP